MGARELLTKLEREPEISFGRLDIEWLERLQAVVRLLERTVMAIAALLVLAVVLVIGNTIRLAIMNRRSEIEVMKLVGATEAFIQRPFLYTGIWYGVIGGILAWLIINLLVWYLDSALAELLGLYGSQLEMKSLTFTELLQLVGLASFLGWLGSYLSVRQHLRSIDLHNNQSIKLKKVMKKMLRNELLFTCNVYFSEVKRVSANELRLTYSVN